jgi:hypothetical protein
MTEETMNNDTNSPRQAMLAEVERDITPGLPRVERAIAFVHTRGMATSSELHMVMELEPNELASDYLDSALSGGLLVKTGKYWMPGTVPASATDAPAYAIPTFVPPRPVDNVVSLEPQRTSRIKPAEKVDFAGFADMVNSEAKSDSAPTTKPAPVIRCGVWSDGSVEVQRDGKTSAVLFVEEVACLADFWKRVSNNTKEAM